MSGINIYESGIPIDQAKDLAAQAQGFRVTGLGQGFMSRGSCWGRLTPEKTKLDPCPAAHHEWSGW